MFCEVELRCDPDFSVAKLYHYPNRSFFSSGAKSRPESATRKFASIQKTERLQNFADAPENACMGRYPFGSAPLSVSPRDATYFELIVSASFTPFLRSFDLKLEPM